MKQLFVTSCIILLVFTACDGSDESADVNSPEGSGSGSTESVSNFMPDLAKELPTKAQTSRVVQDDVMPFAFGGQTNGDMEWHSEVMLKGVKGFVDSVMEKMENSGQSLPEVGNSIEVTLDTTEIFNAGYTSLAVTIAADSSPHTHYLMEVKNSDGVQIVRYLAVPGDTDEIEKGFFVWANATEYQQDYSESDNIHVKEVVEVRFDLSSPNAKQLWVDTVHARLGQLTGDDARQYGFMLRSTYNEDAQSGTGQYVKEGQNYCIKYDLVTLMKTVGEFDELSAAFSDTAEVGSDNQLTGNDGSFTVSDLGFNAHTSSSVPMPYNGSSSSRIQTIIADWESYVEYETIAFSDL